MCLPCSRFKTEVVETRASLPFRQEQNVHVAQQVPTPSSSAGRTPRNLLTGARADLVRMLSMSKMSRPQPASPIAIQHNTPKSPLLFDALSERNFDLAEALIEENRGLQFVSQVHSANTVLHAAVFCDAPTRIIKLLVEKGADVNQGNDVRFAESILAWGEELTCDMKMGRTPVYIAARHNVRLETMRYLISVGGDVNQRDNVSNSSFTRSGTQD